MSTVMAPPTAAATAARAGWAGPAGVDPRSWKRDEVEPYFRSAYFSLFSVPNPEEPDVPIEAKLPFPFSLLQRIPLLDGALLAAVEVNERPLRFKTETGTASCQLLATNTVGHPIASVHIRWTPIPWDYCANPDTNPPQTILNPFVSQRFEMLDGEFRFDDTHGSGVHGFGAGRTFPNFPQGLSLDIGAVIEVLDGFGELAGKTGLMVVNGVITPPNDLALNIMQRIIDPSGDLLTEGPLPPIVPQPFPDPDATFLMVMGEPDPSRPTTLRLGPDGQILGFEVHEQLREVDLDFAIQPNNGVRSQVRTGRIVGRASASWSFPIEDGVPIPTQTSGGRFEFFDPDRPHQIYGSIEADLVEGRGLPTPAPGLPSPLYRIGGFGPIRGGSGEFDDAAGMLSLNALATLFPSTFSHMYIFRLKDPEGRYRLTAGGSLATP